MENDQVILLKEERIKEERIRFRKKIEEEKHREDLYAFFNGDALGT